MDVFGAVLRQAREAARKTLKEMAEAMGWSVVYQSDIERGRRNPPRAEKLEIMARFLGVDLPVLLNAADRDRNRVELDLGDRGGVIEKAGLVLARSWSEISEEQANRIMNILNKESA